MRAPMSWILLLVALVAVPGVLAAQKPYAAGKLLDVQQKTRDKVDMYIVNTPVTTAVPYFEVTLELGGMNYIAEYTPRHTAEELPDAWRVGESVEGRVEKHHLFLKRPDGSEMQWLITKHSPVKKDPQQ